MQALRKRVDAYFEETGLSRRDQPRMYVKTAIILTWLIGFLRGSGVLGVQLACGLAAVCIAWRGHGCCGI